jgi:hypothetical protein
MALDDFMEPEVAVAVAVTAAVASPTARNVIRRGLVYGLASLLVARDKIVSFAHSVKEEGSQQAGKTPPNGAQEARPTVPAIPEVNPS